MEIVHERIAGAASPLERIVEGLGGFYGQSVGVDHRPNLRASQAPWRRAMTAVRDGRNGRADARQAGLWCLRLEKIFRRTRDRRK